VNTNPNDTDQSLCTVLFRLKNGNTDAGRFVFALACFVERWKDVDVISLKVADVDYASAEPDVKPAEFYNPEHGVDHVQQ
jgi:hypothetical protein